jgi:hypothetical protein
VVVAIGHLLFAEVPVAVATDVWRAEHVVVVHAEVEAKRILHGELEGLVPHGIQSDCHTHKHKVSGCIYTHRERERQTHTHA